MNELTSDTQLAFQTFLIQHLAKRLSGSSVLAVDQIEAIQSSIHFVLAHAAKGDTISERYDSGKEAILQQVELARERYQQITAEAEDFQIESLRGTIQELKGFFSSYDVDYAANVTGTIWIDYQLAHPLDTRRIFGVDFVSLFLDSLAAEIRFVNQFPKPVIRNLLTRYQKQLGFDYRKDINNLYELVFNQAIAKLIVGAKSSASLLLTRAESDYLYARRNDREIRTQLARELSNHPYYRQSLDKFFTKLGMLKDPHAMTHFLVLAEHTSENQLELRSNMSAAAYTQLLDRLVCSPDPASLIVAAVQSPYDLLELAEADISEQTWMTVFQQLDVSLIIGLALIIKQENHHSLSLEELENYSDFNEILWAPYQKRLRQLRDTEREQLAEILRTYELTAPDFS